MAKQLPFLHFAFNLYGYCVEVWKGGECLASYSAGNHRLDSQVCVPPSTPFAASIETIQSFCESTARDMGDEYDVLDSRRTYDADLQQKFDVLVSASVLHGDRNNSGKITG